VFESWHVQLINETRRAVLGTVARDGRPHLIPVCFAFVRGRFGITVDEKPKRPGPIARVRNIQRDPRVSLLFDRYDDDWLNLAWLRVDARATVHERGGEFPDMLLALRERYPQYRGMHLEDLPFILIEPERIVGWRWADSLEPGAG
jgi:PPOX class probable F420-dependent enzyme